MNVVDLGDAAAADRGVVGGKGAELARLLAHGFPVPPGFVLTTHACRRLTPGQTELSFEIRADLKMALASLNANEPGTLLAVRSSAKGEDGSTASFAGQYETRLGVAPERLADAVLDVCESARSSHAREYQARRGSGESPMAVVVQRMVRSDTAGVCFTVDPVTRTRCVVINASFGLGESVVSGGVTPDTYVVDANSSAILSTTVGTKETTISLGHTGTVRAQTPEARRIEACLTADQVREITGLALEVEALHGAPVDIEWAYEDGKLFFLQARPVTALAQEAADPPHDWAPESNTTIDPDYPLYSSGNISEVLPGCVTPLSWDHTGRLIEHAFLAQLRTLGAITRTSHPNVLGFFFFRPYVNVSVLLEAAARTPGMTPDTVLEEFVGKPERTTPAITGRDLWPDRLPRLLKMTVTVLRRALSLSRAIVDARRTARRDDERVTTRWLRERSDDELLALTEMNEDLAAPSVVHVWASTLATVSFQQLRGATARWLDDEDGALASALVAGIEGLPSAAPGVELHRLGERVRVDEALTSRLLGAPDDTSALATLSSHPLGEDFDAFIHQFGHRGVAEAELSRPCWREDPTQVVALLRNHLRDGAQTRATVEARRASSRERAIERVRALSWWRRAMLGWLTRRARSGLENRETMKDVVIRRLDRSRRVYAELNRRLVERGLVANPQNTFFLTWLEIRDLLAGSLTPEASKALADRRKRDFAWSTRLCVPKLQEGVARTVDLERLAGTEELHGLGVSPGQALGVARVITDPREDARIEPGEILVAPVTDVAWTPLFGQAAALVVEVGGLLSHGSIVAREYGMPAVVGVRGATRAIRTGDRIAVDGAKGFVRKLD